MFNDRLRSARISKGLTLQKMADRLDLALRTYQNYEMLVQIADILDIPTDFLLGRDEYLKSLGVSVDVPPEGPPRHPKPQKNR